MSHTLDLGARLEAEPETLAAAELLLTKLQIAEVNAKDLSDTAMLLWDHEPGGSDGPGQLNLTADRRPRCAADWGLYTTVTDNLAACAELLGAAGAGRAAPGPDRRPDRGQLSQAAGRRAEVAGAGRLRARVGRRVRWYELPRRSTGDACGSTTPPTSTARTCAGASSSTRPGSTTRTSLILGGDVSGKAVVPVVARRRRLPGPPVLRRPGADRRRARTRPRPGSGTWASTPTGPPTRNSTQTWDEPDAVSRVFLDPDAARRLARWLDLAEQRLAGTGIRLYVMTGNDDPPELQQMLRDSPVLTETEDKLHRPRRGHHDDLLRLVQPRPRGTPRGRWTTTSWSGGSRSWPPRCPARAGRVQPARAARPHGHRPGPALDGSLKPVVKGGAVVMQSVGSEAVRRVLERHQPMLGLHGHIHESTRRGPARRHAVHQPGQRVRRRHPARRAARTRRQARRQALPAAVRLIPAAGTRGRAHRAQRQGDTVDQRAFSNRLISQRERMHTSPEQLLERVERSGYGPASKQILREQVRQRVDGPGGLRAVRLPARDRPRATARWSGTPTARSTWTCWQASRCPTPGTATRP